MDQYPNDFIPSYYVNDGAFEHLMVRSKIPPQYSMVTAVGLIPCACRPYDFKGEWLPARFHNTGYKGYGTRVPRKAMGTP